MSRGHGARPAHGQRATVTLSGKFAIDLKKVETHLRARIPGMVRLRTSRGIDSRGKPFKAYSPDYAKARLQAGRTANPTLSLTGGMVGSFGLRSSQRGRDSLVMRFGPGTTTSPQMSLGKGAAHHTGRRSPPHNLLGWYHESGAGDLPKRRWIGLTKEELAQLTKEIEALGVLVVE